MSWRIPSLRIPASDPATRQALLLGLVALIYFLSGKLGLSFAELNGSVSAVWPPSGIALGSLLLFGMRVWPAIFAGAFLVNATNSGSVPCSLGIAIGNTLEGVIGAFLVNRFAGGPRVFDRPRDIFKFAVLAGLGSTAVSATCGVSSLALAGLARWTHYGALWLNWWIGDVGGDLLVAPFVILWGSSPRVRWPRERLAEAAALLLSLVLVGHLVFGRLLPGTSHRFPLTFLCLPVPIWAAFRFGRREAATATLVLSAIAVRGTMKDVGPFSSAGYNGSLLLLALFTSVVAVTVLTVAAVLADRRSIEQAVRGAYAELGLRFQRQSTDLSRAIQMLRAQVSARTRAERYADAIVATIREPLLVLDSDLRVKAANPAFYRFFRITPESAQNRFVYQLGSWNWDIPDLRRLLEDFLPQNRTLEGFEVEHTFPGIGRRTLILNAQQIVQDESPSRLILLAFLDITERKRAEEALRISVERFRAVAETAADAIISANSRGDIVFFNGAAERIFGYGAGEAIGQPLRTLLPERHHEANRLDLERYLATGDRLVLGKTVELEGRRSDGSEFPLELSLTGWRVRSEVYFTAIARDISERKAAEQKLEESRGQLERAQALAHLGSWTWDVAKERIAASPETFQIHGLEPRPGWIDRSAIADLVHPQDRAMFGEAARRARETGEPLDLEFRIIRPDGVLRWLHTRAEVETGPGAARIEGTSQDITERKRAEQQIRQLNAELERRVQERTAELERSNNELQMFATIAAHDLQEPLRTVTAYTQMLAKRYRGRLDPAADELIAFATEGATWMHQLIDGLLQYSRVGSAKIQCESIDGERVLARALSNLRRALDETRAVVTHDELPRVQGDESQLVLLFQNLLGNALKFRRRAVPKIHVTAHGQGGEWKLGIRDHGLGMEPQHLERIFAIFQRLHGREEFPGTGIGLAICKRIVERHGGRIWAESEPGRGSTFWFTLPGAETAAGAGESSASSVASTAGGRGSEA